MKNNKIWLGILIGVLVGIIVGLTGFIVYDKVVSENNTNSEVNSSNNTNTNNNHLEDNNANNQENNENSNQENNSQSEVVDLSLTDEFVTQMFRLSSIDTDKDMVSEFYKNNKTIIKDLSKEAKYRLFVDWLRESDKLALATKDSNFYFFDKDTVLNEWEIFFGSSTSFPFYDYGSEASGNRFDSDGSYKTCISCGGDVGIGFVNRTLLRATKSDQEIILYTAIKFLDFDQNGDALWYSDYDKTIATTSEANIDANYKFIYKKDINDNYYFYSIERIK